ncbi:hypothetical protein [Paenibacillus xanthanilyticus]|uniref:Uncharacterized protein n=1 Tax=Paenibacillus xanthanilyticus TaxID=1783531 RepID=A0ABV8K2J1_9BACL
MKILDLSISFLFLLSFYMKHKDRISLRYEIASYHWRLGKAAPWLVYVLLLA